MLGLTGNPFWQEESYDRLVREMPDLYKIGYEISDALVPTAMLEGALIVMLYEVLGDVIDRLKPVVRNFSRRSKQLLFFQTL